MSQNYKDFFKAAQQSKKNSPRQQAPSTSPKRSVEDKLRAELKMKPQTVVNKSKMPPLKATSALSLICLTLGFGYAQPDLVLDLFHKVDLLPMSAATAAAAESSSAVGKKSPPDAAEAAKNTETESKSNPELCISPKQMSEEDLSHFKLLSERKKQLDQREQELNTLEEELHKQRVEVESRIQKLESVRGEISTVLKERVEMDQERIKTLVEFYSNMKPKQAADIFATLNEDLAVEVLTQMKKKNAAEIMNLLPADKARTLSEKFTGYKRR